MSSHCLSKKRKLVVISSDDEGSSPPPKSSQRVPPRLGLTRSVSHNPPNLSYSSNAPQSVIVARRSTSVVSSSAPPLTKVLPLHSYFTGSQFPTSSSPQSATNSRATSQHEDLDDLIEDAFSDDDTLWDSMSPRKSISPQSVHSIVVASSGCGTRGDYKKKPPMKIGSSQSKLNTKSANNYTGALRGSRNPVPLAPVTINRFKTVVSDPRPWPERFSPNSSAGLAVNPKKVSEVRSWLEHVSDGFSKQRMLVLKGSAGVGKTATINILSKELGFEVLEWKNPSSATLRNRHGEEGAFSAGLSGLFEEFVGRACKFGSLDMVSTSPTFTGTKSTPPSISSDTGDNKKMLILIEEFPNTLFTSSTAPQASFRHAIKSYLAIPAPPRTSPPLPPLVLIISESAIVTGPSAFTAHRLLSPDIIHHPLSTSITFNKIAPTFMLKALSSIMAQESRESGRKFGPSKSLMEALSTSGDVRSAIMGLEFLAVNGELGAFSERVSPTRKKRQKLRDSKLSELEQKILMGVNQRESRFGVFHAVGKVVYNKRYGDDVDDLYVPPPPKPLLDIHPYQTRASRVDVNNLMDEAGADTQTLISGLHENYLGSCNFLGGFSRRTHSLEDLLYCVNDCISDLSDSDILASPRPYHKSLGTGGRGGSYEASEGTTSTGGIRQDEISFQAAVRGIMLALPSPVKRDVKGNKMFYPTSLKLWREREEIEGMVDLLIMKYGRSDDQYMSGILGRSEMVLERLPYLKAILKGHQRKKANSSYGTRIFDMTGRAGGGMMQVLEKVTALRGISVPNDDVPDEQFTEVLDELEAAEERELAIRATVNDRAKAKLWKRKERAVEELDIMTVEGLVLSDDDIEDDW